MKPVPKNGGGHRHLKHLTEDVKTKCGDNNGGNVNAPSSNLNALEENQHHNGNERRVPRNEAIDDMANNWTHSHTCHAQEAEKANYQPKK